MSQKTPNPDIGIFRKRTLELCIGLALSGGLAMQPSIAAAKTKRHQPTRQEIELEEENAKLRRQVAELQSKLNTVPAAAAGTAAAASPFSVKEITKTSTQTAATDKTTGGMACGANMMGGGMKMEPGSQFFMNPVWGGLDMFWNMPKDSIMMNVKWMHNQQTGLQQGASPVDANPGVAPYSHYMMPPTSQTMDMFMFMPMWGVTEDLTLMAMINYQYMSMPMQMNMATTQPMAPMNNGGLMDTDIDVIYRISHDFVGTLQLSIPTGSTQQTYNPGAMGLNCSEAQGGEHWAPGCWNNLSPYGMQMGAGVPGLTPALTYNWVSDDYLWNIGGQASGTAYLSTADGWSPGNMIKLSIWGQRAIDGFTVWLRSNYTNQAQIQGCSTAITGNCINPSAGTAQYETIVGGTGAIMPGFNPANYGGEVLTVLLGASYQYGMFNFGIEGGIPAYQNLNGIQLMNSYYINAGTSFMF